MLGYYQNEQCNCTFRHNLRGPTLYADKLLTKAYSKVTIILIIIIHLLKHTSFLPLDATKDNTAPLKEQYVCILLRKLYTVLSDVDIVF
jgi:hypothetical protein